MAKLFPFYQANISNYSPGREQPIRYVTVHHSAGWEQTLRYLWGDPNRNASSHFWVGNAPDHIEQYVDTNDTAWTNGNWRSNNESITIEVRGDWRGFYDQQTLNNLGKLLYKIRQNYPNVQIEYHQDVSDKITECPADLKHKGYARAVWDSVTQQLNPATPPAPQPTPITYEKITPKRVKLKVTTNLWNFNFANWSDAKAVQPYGAGSVIDVVAIATNALGGKYYMTAYSYNEGNIRATNGFNTVDCEDYVPVVTQPPTVELKWEAMQNPRKMRLLTASKVVNLDNMQEQGDVIAVGTDIDLVELKTVKPGEVYARSKWSRDNGKNWGIRLDRFGEVPSTTTEPPREPVPEPPLDVDPTTPGAGDVVERLNFIERILKLIAEKLGINWK
jgi:hypothetical protein